MPTSLYGPYTGPQLFRVCNRPNRKTLFCIPATPSDIIRARQTHTISTPESRNELPMHERITQDSGARSIKTAKEDSGDQLSRTDLLLGLVKLVS